MPPNCTPGCSNRASRWWPCPTLTLDYSGRAEARLLRAGAARLPARSLALASLAPVRARRSRPLLSAPGAAEKCLHRPRGPAASPARGLPAAPSFHAPTGSCGRARLRGTGPRGLDAGARAGARAFRAGHRLLARARAGRRALVAPDHPLGFPAMLARARVMQARLLPRGWLDALRQLLLFFGAYLAYRFVRGLVEGEANEAFAHARDLISLERGLHVFVEPSIQAWASGSHALIVVASWVYVNAQTTVTVAALRVPVPAPQPQLLLRAQHVHDRDGDRAGRLPRVPDCAAALLPRVGLHRHRLGLHRHARVRQERAR